MGKQTAAKAWAGALSGVIISLLSLLSGFLSEGTVDPVAITGFGNALGILTESLIMAGVGYLTVYFAPRNQDKET